MIRGVILMEDKRSEMDKKRETVLKWIKKYVPSEKNLTVESNILQDDCAVDFAMKEIERGVKGTDDVKSDIYTMMQLADTD